MADDDATAVEDLPAETTHTAADAAVTVQEPPSEARIAITFSDDADFVDAASDIDEDAVEQGGKKLSKKRYERELEGLRAGFVRLEDLVSSKKWKIVVLLEGRDVGRKGNIANRLAEDGGRRVFRTIAAQAPTPRERSQWFFQPFVAELPGAGEVVLFDGGWYTRALIGRLTGVFSESEYRDLMEGCVAFERLLIRSGVKLVKFWTSVTSDDEPKVVEEQARTLARRSGLRGKQIEAALKLQPYGDSKDLLFAISNVPDSPWQVIRGSDKREARLESLRQLLDAFRDEDAVEETVEGAPAENDGPPIATI